MKATKDAKITIVNLYVIILSFLAKATRYFKKGTLSKQENPYDPFHLTWTCRISD